MLLNIGTIYKVGFDTGFTAIDDVYQVLQIINHNKLLELEVDLVSTLYTAVGKTQEDYDADKASYLDGYYYELSSMTQTDVSYFVPISIISSMPEIDINKYKKLILTFDIGTFNNTDELSTITTSIQETLTANHGITSSPQLMSYDEVWLTDVEYTAIEDARAAVATGATNYYSEAIRLEQELTQATAKIAALEAIIVALQ